MAPPGVKVISVNSDIHHCRLCGTTSLSERLKFERAPSSVERLLSREQLESDRGGNLSVVECDSCGFVQLLDPMPPEFYDDYEMALTFSTGFRQYLVELRDLFMAISGLTSGRLVEIGCGDGTFLDSFRERGFEVEGVEPSAPFRAQAQAKGLTVHSCYIAQNQPAPGGPYDAVVTRQVLEHVFDIQSFLAGVTSSLRPGGAALIEVPSVEQSVDAGRYYDFFPDHVNYFSAPTLSAACAACGLEVLEIRRTFGGEYLSAILRRPLSSGLAQLRVLADQSMEDANHFLEREKIAGKRVAIWGGGGKGVSALASIGWDGVSYVVDSDPRKQGKFLPVSHLEVFSPETLLADPVDTVLITALAHRDEIIQHLLGQIKFNGTIAALGRNTEIIQR